MAKRAWKSESSVDSNYIYKLHEHHEEWFNKTSFNEPILILDSDDHKVNAAKAIDFINAIKTKIIWHSCIEEELVCKRGSWKQRSMDHADQSLDRLIEKIGAERTERSMVLWLTVNCFRFCLSSYRDYPRIEINVLYILLEFVKQFFTCSRSLSAGILSFEQIGQKR